MTLKHKKYILLILLPCCLVGCGTTLYTKMTLPPSSAILSSAPSLKKIDMHVGLVITKEKQSREAVWKEPFNIIVVVEVYPAIVNLIESYLNQTFTKVTLVLEEELSTKKSDFDALIYYSVGYSRTERGPLGVYMKFVDNNNLTIASAFETKGIGGVDIAPYDALLGGSLGLITYPYEKAIADKMQKIIAESVSKDIELLSNDPGIRMYASSIVAMQHSAITENSGVILTDYNISNLPKFKDTPRDNDLAIVVGIEKYQNAPNSEFSGHDANLVRAYFKALGFQERNIEFITDEKATRSSIEKAIEAWLPNRVKRNSKVYVYYSGHGAPEPTTGEAYIVPYDGDPNYLSITGYPLKRLYDKLGKLQAQEVVVLLDSCFSGSGGRSVLAKGARPLVMLPGTTVLPSNMAVLTATQGSQISTSSPEKEHGVFTYYFLKALKDGKKELSEIYDYIKPLIEDEAKSLNVSQSPSITPESAKIKGKFNLRP